MLDTHKRTKICHPRSRVWYENESLGLDYIFSLALCRLSMAASRAPLNIIFMHGILRLVRLYIVVCSIATALKQVRATKSLFVTHALVDALCIARP